MKKVATKLISAIAVSAVLLAPSIGHTQDLTEEQQVAAQMCMIQTAVATETMTHRQQGLKKTEAQKRLKDKFIDSDSSQNFLDTISMIINGFITMAYDKPIAKTNAEKEKAIEDFSFDIGKICFKELVGIDIK